MKPPSALPLRSPRGFPPIPSRRNRCPHPSEPPPAPLAGQWFKILNALVPTDPTVLARIGNIYLKEEDEAQAFHYHQEAYRLYPVNMNVISWLGAYFVKNEMCELHVVRVGFFTSIPTFRPRSQVREGGHLL